MNQKNGRSIPKFPISNDVGARPWGKEEILVIVPGKYMLKKLFISAGQKGGLQYHRKKDECGILLSGKMIIRHDDGLGNLVEKILTAGEIFHFEPGVVHQEEALEDCIIIEGSTPHFNDRVRVESLYGLPDSGGMATTELNEILER